MYGLHLSFRFLRHHWLMTLIGSFFVGASLVILVVVMAVMDGFQTRLMDTVRGSSADFILRPNYPVDVDRLVGVLKQEMGDRALAVAPYYQTTTIARKAGKVSQALEETFHMAVVSGVDARAEQRLNAFGASIEGGVHTNREEFLADPFRIDDEFARAAGDVGVIVGAGLLHDMKVTVGSRIRLVIPVLGDAAADKPEDIKWRYESFEVVGTYKSGNHDIDKVFVCMDYREFARRFDVSLARPSVRMKLAGDGPFDDRYDDARAWLGRPGIVERVVRASTPPGVTVDKQEAFMAIESWKQQNVTLVRAIESEKSLILMIAFLIVVAGASSIFAAQWLLVTDKVREIGILRALGAGVGGVTAIFITNGFLMGVLGSAGGAALGLYTVHEIDAVHGFLSWILGRPVFDPSIYLFDKIPTLVDPAQVWRFSLSALVCTLFASAIPALRAGLMKPAVALHRE